jgi:hypothetical protein
MLNRCTAFWLLVKTVDFDIDSAMGDSVQTSSRLYAVLLNSAFTVNGQWLKWINPILCDIFDL